MSTLVKYSDEIVAKVKDYAAVGLYPTQIANKLELRGKDRELFLCHINMQLHPLCTAYRLAFDQYAEDLEAALITSATAGDVDALELAYKVQDKSEVDELKQKLFNV